MVADRAEWGPGQGTEGQLGPQGCLILPPKVCTPQSWQSHPGGYLGLTREAAITGSTPKAEASVKGQSDTLGFAGAGGGSRVFFGPGTAELSHILRAKLRS